MGLTETRGIQFPASGDHEQVNWDRSSDIASILSDYDKPVIYGELGDGGKIDSCDAISFHNDLWATMMMGCMGTGLNWHWYQINTPSHLSNMLPLKNFLLNEDFESNNFHTERWNDGTNNNSSTGDFESYQLINYSSTYGMGWVHNRWYWWYTISPCSARNGGDIPHSHDLSDFNHEDPIPLSGLTVTIKDLKSCEPYLIDWYYTSGTGGHYIASNVNSNLWGRIVTTIPPTDNIHRDWAYKLYWIGDKNQSMTPNNNLLNNVNSSADINTLMLKQQDDSTMQIFPNPGKGLFNIEFGSTIDGSLTVYNSLGVVVFKKENFTFSKYLLDLTFLKSGVYYILISTNDKSFTKKLIVEN